MHSFYSLRNPTGFHSATGGEKEQRNRNCSSIHVSVGTDENFLIYLYWNTVNKTKTKKNKR
jgi:hypothetical protein